MRVTTRGVSPAAVMLAASLGLSLAGAHRGMAAPASLSSSPHLRLLSPTTRATFEGVRPIEIDAMYEGTPGNGIVSLDLFIDGVKAQSQPLSSPEMRGMVSFLVDASLLTPGTHYVVVRATAADAEVRSVRGSFVYDPSVIGSGSALPGTTGDPNALEWPSAPGTAPEMHLMYPAPNSKVQGNVTVRVDANDADGKPPYISIFVDGDMKQLVNYRPFEYDWDTTSLPNGWHTITVVEAFDDASVPVAHLQPIRVYVNNPGGQTMIRHDLLDAPKTIKPVFSKPMAPVTPRLLPRKMLAARPLARRPLGAALLAVPRLPALRQSLIAQLDPRWDGLASVLNPALSDPAVADLPAPRSKMPLRHFKSTTTPRTAALPQGKKSQRVPVSVKPPMLLAQHNSISRHFAAPLLSLPTLPAAAAPHHVAVAVPAPKAPAMHLRIHLPVQTLHTPRMVKPHVGMGAATLLRVVGEKQIQFNHTNLMLDRPIAMQQNILFGPLRRIFEYGGGTLQWQARGGIVRADSPNRDLELKIGDRQATLNQKPFKLASAPYISAGRTMVPLSFIGAAMDAKVQYDPATGHLKITSRH